MKLNIQELKVISMKGWKTWIILHGSPSISNFIFNKFSPLIIIRAMALRNHDVDDEDKHKRVVNSFENEV